LEIQNKKQKKKKKSEKKKTAKERKSDSEREREGETLVNECLKLLDGILGTNPHFCNS